MSDIKVRVGQENTIKVVSSISGSAGGFAFSANNVIGGIASVTSLSVSGVSTFVGLSTFTDVVYTNNLYSTRFFYSRGITNGIAYFGQAGILTSTSNPDSQFTLSTSNQILTADDTGRPSWSVLIDGGSF